MFHNFFADDIIGAALEDRRCSQHLLPSKDFILNLFFNCVQKLKMGCAAWYKNTLDTSKCVSFEALST